MENKVTADDDVKSMLEKIYEQEFTEPNMRFTSVIGETTGHVSYDNQIFLRLMDQETVQVYNHYKVNRCHLPKQQPCCHEEVKLFKEKVHQR